jgi:hypothetical protein
VDAGLDLLDPALVWVAKKGEDVHATTPELCILNHFSDLIAQGFTLELQMGYQSKSSVLIIQ